MLKRLSIPALAALVLALPFAAPAQEQSAEAAAPEASQAAASPRVALDTSKGRIVLELDAGRAPATVENFLQYVRDGHYNGTIFHRVIDNFMIQGGGFTKELQRKPTREPIRNEANNGLSNLRGTISMARTNDPHSARGEFFINVVDNPRLDFVSETNGLTWGYAVFGKVVEGMDVVDAIRALETGPQGPFAKDVPKEAVVIQRAEVLPDADAGQAGGDAAAEAPAATE